MAGPGVTAEQVPAVVRGRKDHNDARWKATVLRRTERKCTDAPDVATRITMMATWREPAS